MVFSQLVLLVKRERIKMIKASRPNTIKIESIPLYIMDNEMKKFSRIGKSPYKYILIRFNITPPATTEPI